MGKVGHRWHPRRDDIIEIGVLTPEFQERHPRQVDPHLQMPPQQVKVDSKRKVLSV